ncbi:hypothetical protein HXX76_010291 [Chlamydomonas incerta]|uniref:Uncharacterized protein n=1 Tax=Chlamydomonas incerta TaxID=51695 RepID=A0A835SN29_CHLIN|nr:hypothetical protein HXX76_010291 [Chlamydomonas incerta]|eukprot:KAG2430192.1 hypothetical protein HXX76_010291 [Chlamydomonas incerta]
MERAASEPSSTEPSETSGDAAPSTSTFSSGPDYYTFYDVFFWRDAPDWYRKTFHATGFGLAFCALKQYMNRHELEVFLPPRSKVLPDTLRDGYRNSQMLKYGFLKVGKETTVIAGAAAAYYAGAYYLGEWRGAHTWHNFAASGAASGVGSALWLLRPVRARPLAFAAALGAALGGASALGVQALGVPFWEEGHDFEGYFFGSKVNLRKEREERGKKGRAAGAEARSAAEGA